MIFEAFKLHIGEYPSERDQRKLIYEELKKTANPFRSLFLIYDQLYKPN